MKTLAIVDEVPFYDDFHKYLLDFPMKTNHLKNLNLETGKINLRSKKRFLYPISATRLYSMK